MYGKNIKRRFKFFATMALVSFSSIGIPCDAFTSIEGTSGHSDITRDALGGILSEGNLKVVIDSNCGQDKPGSEGLSEARRHFGDEGFISTLAYIDREKKRALNYAAESDTDPESRGYALKHLGELLHSVQDFYSRTNYVELMVAGDYRSQPYDIPLVDWQKVPSGYPGLKCFSARAGSSNAAELANMVKDSPDSTAGKKIVQGKVTQFQVARDLAVRETTRQWNLFETMIKGRCGTRAPAVIAAIKQASPEFEKSKPQEKDD